MIDSVIAALAAGDGATALDRLLIEWRTTRAAALGDAVIALGNKLGDDMTVAIREVCTGNASEALERMRALDLAPADPRVLAAIVAWIADPPFHATGSQPFWRAALALVVRDGDTSLAQPLAAATQSAVKQIKGATMRAWLAKQLAAIELTAPAGNVSPRDTEAVAGAIATYQPRVGTPLPRHAAATSDEAALLAAIWAAPFDDAPRGVYADWLANRGDPRGEFIALQLARARRSLEPDDAARELALLRKHAKLWVGEVARGLYAFTQLVSTTPPVELDRGNTAYFTRGFLSRLTLQHFNKAQLKKLAGHPVLATVEDVTCGRTAYATDAGAPFATFLAHPSLRALRRVYVPADLALALVDGPHAGRIVELSTVRYHDDIAPVFAALASFPALKRFRLVAVEPNAADERLAELARQRLGARVTIDIADWNAS